MRREKFFTRFETDTTRVWDDANTDGENIFEKLGSRKKSLEAGSATAEVFGFHVPFENLFSFVFDPSGSEVGSETENSIS